MTMLDDVLAIPDHVRDALWKVESAQLQRSEAAGLLVCGVGTAAIGADLAAAALGERLQRPLSTVRGCSLPSWATADWAVLCSSYSGESEEPVACFAAAGGLGARRVVASTGGALVAAAREGGVPVIGLPGLLSAPRTAVAYMLVCAAEVAALTGVAPRIHDELEGAAAFLERQRDELQDRAATIAARLAGSVPVFYGAGSTVPVARRWKTQLNESAKMPAFHSDLEGGSTELCAWEAPASDTRLVAALLEDPAAGPPQRRRFQLAAAAIEAAGAEAVSIEAAGESRAERVLWATMLGDLVSLALAETRR